MTIEISGQTGEEINSLEEHPSTVPSLEDNVNELTTKAKALTIQLEASHKEVIFLQQQVESLQATNSTLRSDLQQKRIDHVRDITLIGEALLEKAKEYEWCGTYDRAVEELNQRLSISLPLRRKEFLVEGTVTFNFSLRVELDGDSGEDEAQEYAEEADNNELNIDFSRYSRSIEINSVEED